jgi:hypothetical protein
MLLFLSPIPPKEGQEGGGGNGLKHEGLSLFVNQSQAAGDISVLLTISLYFFISRAGTF